MSGSSHSSTAVNPALKPSDRLSPVLVLGSRAGARRIALGLSKEGFEPDVPGWTDELLPSLTHPESSRLLSELLMRWMGDLDAQIEGGSKKFKSQRYLHPGMSLWADRPELPSIAQACHLNLIAPSARTLTFFSNRLSFLLEAESIGIPNLLVPPAELMHSVREIEIFINRNGLKFPFVLKSAKGHSRLGVRVVQSALELESKLPLWMDQLRRNCGEVILFAERYVEGARLITLPFVRALDGSSETFPMIDGSLQCGYRKIVEFCPAEGIEPRTERELRDWTQKLAHRAGFVGVGALDFLMEGQRPYLVSGAAKLELGFHLWEQVGGTDAVSWQIAAMRGGLGAVPHQAPRPPMGAAVGLRIYAEDPILQLPQPGWVRELSERRTWTFPAGMAELELRVGVGEEVRPSGHGLIGSLIAAGSNRAQAVVTARGVLDELWIAGSLQTNERFLSELLIHPWIKEGIFHTGFIDEEFLPALRPPAEFLKKMVAVVLNSASELSRIPIAGERWAAGDQWVKAEKSDVEWVAGPTGWDLGRSPTDHLSGVSGQIKLSDGRMPRVLAYPIHQGKWQVKLGPWTLMVRRLPPKSAARPKAESKLTSMIAGRVHSILYRGGAVVPAHEPLLILESLGLLVPHALPVEVRIHRWKVAAEDWVVGGQDLADFEILAK